MYIHFSGDNFLDLRHPCGIYVCC